MLTIPLPFYLRRLFRDVYYRQSFSFKEHQFGISEHYDISNQFYQLFLDNTYMDYDANTFDTIFSIGSIEHVRENELLPLCQNLSKALKPNGKLVHQFFCQMEDVIPTRLIAVALNIFPGSELTSFKKHLDIFEQANLKVIHHSIHDYRPTLEAWFNCLVANQTAAIELVGVQNYNKYQCYLAEVWRLFNDRDLMLMQFVLKKL